MPLLSVSNFTASSNQKELVSSISFDLQEGLITGIVGESGSGKSVTCMGLTRLLPKTISINGNVLYQNNKNKPVDLLNCSIEELRKLRGSEIAYIFQEPMSALNPVLTCGSQVSESLLIHQKLSKNELKLKVLELFDEVKLPDTQRIYDSYPHQISGGQRQRVMISMALANNPKLLIADEPTTALDASVQKSIIDLLVSMVKKRGMSMIFISHDLNCIKNVADHILVMYKGSIVEQGIANEIFFKPLHPYTKALMKTRPSFKQANTTLPTISDLLYLDVDGEIKEKEFIEKERIQNRVGETILEVVDLKKIYRSKSFLLKSAKDKPVLQNISFSLKQNETLGIVGESGCGKSTLARILTGLESKTEGRIIFGKSNSNLMGRQIQMVFQDPFSSLNPSITAGNAIMEPLLIHKMANKKVAKNRVIQLLELTGLNSDYFDKYPHQMSGGQRQRICIARALALQPSILILDESVAALDVSVQSQILNLLKDLQIKLGLSYLFISHDLNVVGYMADRIMVLKNGEIAEHGKAMELLTKPQTDYTKFLINCMYE